MSTRSIIARPSRDSFVGRYHHSDGYPAGVGRALYELYNGHFKRDAEAMLKVLLDDHPAGWSNIVDADFTLKPGWSEKAWRKPENRSWEEHRKTRDYRRPHCFCHGDRHEEAQEFTSEMSTDTEWAYVINAKTHKMYVHKHIGHTGGDFMDGKDMWQFVEEVDLDGPEPDWYAMKIYAGVL